MKVVRSRALDVNDRRRFVELTPRVNADAEREAEYLAMLFNSQFVRESWRTANKKRRRK